MSTSILNTTPKFEIRGMTYDDLPKVKAIFDRFYAEDERGTFSFPDYTKYLCAFVVELDGEIITAGGIRSIAEVCLITDKDFATRTRVEALMEVFRACKFVSGEFNIERLHAITDDQKWGRQMEEKGFIKRGDHFEIHVKDIK